MDFFARQERSRRTTRFLVIAFVASFAAVAAAATAVTAAFLRLYSRSDEWLVAGSGAGWMPQNASLLALVGGGTLLLMTLASLYRAASLARGGGQVARLLGGTELAADTTDLAQRRLINVVEEMAIASGLPLPDVYVLEHEPGINAFAAGLTPSDAAIAVTRGAIDRLDRTELQGVVAHEFSHILNGDMRLNQQLIGLSFGVLVLSLVGRWLLRTARYGRRGRNSGGIALAVALGAAFALIGSIGLLLSRLIKAAVSREREMLADASAVQFTREPSGLASALKKIGGYSARLETVEAEEVAHMLFERSSRAFRGWLATHPPLAERIRALDPSFDPAELARSGAAATGAPAAHGPAASLAAAAPSAPEALLARAGTVGAPAVGGRLRAALPEELYAAARSRESSFLLVLAVALSADETQRRKQLALLEAQLGAPRATRCARLKEELARLDPKLRIPILELAMPALKQRPAEQLDYLLSIVERLTSVDGEIDLFDYVLLRMLTAYLLDVPDAVIRAKPAELPIGAALESLLAAVAAHGHADADAARAAFHAGLGAVGRETGRRSSAPAVAVESSKDLGRLDAALLRLRRLPPRGKRAVLKAVLATIGHDRRFETAEVELFRAIAATLGCPLPPAFAELPA